MTNKTSWLAPYVNAAHLKFYRLASQVAISVGLFVCGILFISVGLYKDRGTAVTLGTGFVSTAVGYWLR